MQIDMSFTGSDLMLKTLERLSDKARQELVKEATKAGAEYLAKEIRKRTPRSRQRRRGGRHMADSYKVKPLKTQRGRGGHLVQSGSKAELGEQGKQYYYPAGVELGNRKTPPSAPMRIAVQVARNAVLAVMREVITQGIRRGVGL